MAITLTEKAAEALKRYRQQHDIPEEYPVRVAVRGGGCSGFEHMIAFEEQPIDEKLDELHDFHGVKIVVDRKSLLYLDGTTIDYYDGFPQSGFKFDNPNAQKTCGCGHSFSV